MNFSKTLNNRFVASVRGIIAIGALWCLLFFAPAAVAYTSSYQGISVEWDAGLNDISVPASGGTYANMLFYESAQLPVAGGSLDIKVTLPAAFAQNTSFISLYSPYGLEMKKVRPVANTDGTFADLVLEYYGYFQVTSARLGYQAFFIWVVTDDGNYHYNDFTIRVGLAESAQKYIGNNPDLLGDENDQQNTEFDGGSCSIGFPAYSVNTATLNLVVQDTEFSVQSLGPRLATTRTWNSDPSWAGMFGNGWSFAYESTLRKFCGGAQVIAGSRKGNTFTADLCPASGSLTYPLSADAPEGVFDKLRYMDGDYWLLEKKDTRETYRYELAGGNDYRLRSITDRNGNALTVLYNTDGTIASVTDAAGRQLAFTYDANKRVVALGTPDGRQVSFGYDARGNLVRTVDLYGTEVLYQYDADNYLSSMSYAGKTISYTYDTSGGWKHIATITDANGAVRSYSGTTGSTATKITDARNGTITTTSSEGKTASVVDGLGNKTSMTYAKGLRTAVTDAKGKTRNLEYDARGNPTKLTDASGKITTYTYDANDNPLTQTNALGETWTYAYDAKSNLTSVTSPGNKVSTLTYDAKGQLTGVTDAKGNSTTYTYDSFGNTLTVTDALGKTTTFGYDSAGINRISALDANGNASAFAYDANRRLTRITHADGKYRDFSFDACAMTGITDENGNALSISRDKMLRVTATTDALNAVSANTYDGNGNLVTTTDALTKSASLAYDAANRLTTLTDPAGSSVSFTRDANGNVAKIQDERLKQTTITFDADDRVLTTTDPLARTVSITRDDLGRQAKLQNARGGLIGISYDTEGRLSTKTYDAVTAASFTYDDAGNLASITDAGGTTSYTYNARNQVTAITYPDAKAVAFGYDAAGNMVSIDYPGGLALTYAMSNRNRVQSMQWGTNSIAFGHDAAGNLLSETRSNGTSAEYAYDANNRLNSIRHKKGTSAFASMDYTRNAIGNIVSESATLPAAVSLASTSDTGAYDDVNQISTFGGSSYSYDADGNLTGISGAKTFTGAYDLENRLTQMTSGGVSSNYSYNALGNRVGAVRGTQTAKYYHDHSGRLLFEADGSGDVVNYYLYKGGRLVAMRTAAGASYFYHYDKTGSTVAITDASGDTANTYAYTPYGEIAGSTETIENRFKYVGAYGVMDEGGGIYFMKNRYYDAATGRFLQKDPIGFDGGQTNLYAYVRNNPVNRTDAEGLGGRKGPPIRGLTPAQAQLKADQQAADDVSWWNKAEAAWYAFDKLAPAIPGVGDVAFGSKVVCTAINTGVQEGQWSEAGKEIAVETGKWAFGKYTALNGAAEFAAGLWTDLGVDFLRSDFLAGFLNAKPSPQFESRWENRVRHGGLD